MSHPPHFILSSEVNRAISLSLPIVALESTVITHGLPHPKNLTLAMDMENEIRNLGVTPATIAVLLGEIHVGLTGAELEQLATPDINPPRHPIPRDLQQSMLLQGESESASAEQGRRKISRRDFASAITLKDTGGTTVAGTLFAANQVGLKVFATGGIGGVHDVSSFDISTDLMALADTPMIVICAGAKSILDLPATLELLETLSVPVVGYQTDEFPAFYTRESGLSLSVQLNTPGEVVEFARSHWAIGMQSSILVCQPVPESEAMDRARAEAAIKQAKKEARTKKLRGAEITPFLLSRLVDITEGASLRANTALLLNNARLAAEVARILSAAHRKLV